jgi:hypothetical protein
VGALDCGAKRQSNESVSVGVAEYLRFLFLGIKAVQKPSCQSAPSAPPPPQSAAFSSSSSSPISSLLLYSLVPKSAEEAGEGSTASLLESTMGRSWGLRRQEDTSGGGGCWDKDGRAGGRCCIWHRRRIFRRWHLAATTAHGLPPATGCQTLSSSSWSRSYQKVST